MCRYKLATCWQKFTEIYLICVKILQKVFFFLGGGTFLTHTVYIKLLSTSSKVRMVF